MISEIVIDNRVFEISISSKHTYVYQISLSYLLTVENMTQKYNSLVFLWAGLDLT